MEDLLKKQFVTYEIALKLKELGFDEPCIAYWKNGFDDLSPALLSEFILDNSRTVYYIQCKGIEVSAPLWQQAWTFLMNKLKEEYYFISYKLFSDYSGNISYTNGRLITFSNQEEAILKCIDLIK